GVPWCLVGLAKLTGSTWHRSGCMAAHPAVPHLQRAQLDRHAAAAVRAVLLWQCVRHIPWDRVGAPDAQFPIRPPLNRWGPAYQRFCQLVDTQRLATTP